MRLRPWERWLLAMLALLAVGGVALEAAEWARLLHARTLGAIARALQP